MNGAELRAAAEAATEHESLRALYLDAIGLECVDAEGLQPDCTIAEARAAVLELAAAMAN